MGYDGNRRDNAREAVTVDDLEYLADQGLAIAGGPLVYALRLLTIVESRTHYPLPELVWYCLRIVVCTMIVAKASMSSSRNER